LNFRMTKKTILIADDDESIRYMMKSLFEIYLSHYNKEYFSNGTQLDKRLKERPKELVAVLTDDNMPGIRGLEIIKKYCNNSDYKDILFFLCYGGEREIGEQALENGAKEYFLKPIEFSRLTSKLKEYLEN